MSERKLRPLTPLRDYLRMPEPSSRAPAIGSNLSYRPAMSTLQADHVFGRGRRGGLARERRPDDAAVLVELHAQA